MAEANVSAVELDKSEIAPCPGDGIGDGLHAAGVDLAIFVEQHRGAEHEVAAVPEIAGLDVAGGGRRIRLLDEFRNRSDLARDDFAGADVAVFGGGAFRLYAKGHDVPCFRGRKPLTAGGDERRVVAHDVIGRQRQHDCVLVARLRES